MTKTARGTKRKCQNDECASLFYDLNQTECSCPICGTTLDVRAADEAVATARAATPSRRFNRMFPLRVVPPETAHGKSAETASEHSNAEQTAGDVPNVDSDEEGEASVVADSPPCLIVDDGDEANVVDKESSTGDHDKP